MIFEFKGNNNCNNKCEIDLLGKVVIATQLDSDDIQCKSITNAAEMFAKAICDKYKIPYNELIWIEHNRKKYLKSETYEIVQFEIINGSFANPRWKGVSLKELSHIITNQSGYENIDNYVDKNIKKLKRDYKSRLALLQAICQHQYYITSEDGTKRCDLCEVELE